MASHTWAEIVLAMTLLAPLASVLVLMLVAIEDHDGRWATGGCALAAGGATVLLVTGQHPVLSRLAPDDLALVAIAGTALLALCDRDARRRPASAIALTITGCGI